MIKKKYLPEGLSREERTTKLNEVMRTVKPAICVERAEIVTQSYRGTEGFPPIYRRAKALKDCLDKMTIFISDYELIVGNHGKTRRSAPIFPEFGCLSEKELELMPIRKVDTLEISEADKKKLLDEIYPYWKNKCTGDIARNYIDKDIFNLLDSPYRVFDPLSRTRSGYGHYIPNIKKVLTVGFKGLEREIDDKITGLDKQAPNYEEKIVFYRSLKIVIEGIKNFAKRYSLLAAEMAVQEKDPRRKKELELISENCARVPYEPATNFFEALQSYWFTILIDYISQNGSAISGGRFDQYMSPFYFHDIQGGVICKEEALEMLEALWIMHSDIIKAGTFNSAKNNGGFATTINLVLGGMNENGKDSTNEFSYLCLEAERHIFNSEPNTSIRLSAETPNDFLLKIIELLLEKQGGKLPLFNDSAIISGLTATGVSLEDARNYAIVGCVEPTPVGNTMGVTNACYFNLAKCLELALNNGVCHFSAEQMGPKTEDPLTFVSFDQVKEAYAEQVNYFTKMMLRVLNSIEYLQSIYTPHVYSSLLLDGCIEKGIDCTAGGAKYNYVGVQGVGMVDVGDSLTAIKTLVFDKKIISMQELLAGLKSNFTSNPLLQNLLINGAPKYGNDIDEADRMVAWVAEQYCDCISNQPEFKGGIYRPGLFCLSSNTPLGKQVQALPSGRLEGTPLADGGISPKHSMDTHGPTAASKSVAKIDHLKAINGVNFNLKFLPSILKNRSDRQKLIDMVRSYFDINGFHIQFNIISPEVLMAAKVQPEKYRSLVVRVAGYSAFFVELDGDIQDEIIARTTQLG